MIARIVVQTTLVLAVMGAVLFLAAGDWRWPQAWLFLGEFGAAGFAISFWLLRHDPALLESRMSFPVQRDQVRWDRFFMLAASVVFIGWLALMGLDARRFGWSEVPVLAQGLGIVLIALGMAVVWWTFRFNSFAAPQVRVQIARAHRVITEGPYRIVRHPMYAGSILYLVGMPLLLGSWWGLAMVPLMVVGLTRRIAGEERMLRHDLAGYEEYAGRVRWRLVPGVW